MIRIIKHAIFARSYAPFQKRKGGSYPHPVLEGLATRMFYSSEKWLAAFIHLTNIKIANETLPS